jgi:predicted PurR-regulated permease PerM
METRRLRALTPVTAMAMLDGGPRRVLLTGGLVMLFLGAAWLLWQAGPALCVLFAGIVLATAVRPIVDTMMKSGIPRSLAAVAVFVALGAVGFASLWIALPLFTQPISTLGAKLPGYYDELRRAMLGSSSAALHQLGGHLPVSPIEGARSAVTAALGTHAWDQVAALPRTALALATMVLVGVSWSIEGGRARRRFVRLFSDARRTKVEAFLRDAERRVGGYVRGQLLLSLSVGALAATAYALLGLPHALALGVFAAATEVLPVVGPLLGALPALLLALSLGPATAMGVLAAAVLIQLIENNLLAPRILARSVGMNALFVLLAVASFGALFGIAGAAIAVPAAALLQLAARTWWQARPQSSAPPDLAEETKEIEVAARLLKARAVDRRDEDGAAAAGELEALARGLGQHLAAQGQRALIHEVSS